MSSTTYKKSTDMHPCPYCDKSCFGKQCKECHLKMVSERSNNCCDCEKSFYALKKDGTLRSRCFDCQKIFETLYVSTCPDCKQKFRNTDKNGRVFEKCFDCYTNGFHKCESCDKTIPVSFSKCLDCKKTTTAPRQDDREMRKCAKKGCDNLTPYTVCSGCYKEERNLSNQYMFYRCQKEGCRVSGRGNYKFCEEHS